MPRRTTFHIRVATLFVLFSIPVISGLSQQLTNNQIKTGYVFNFLKIITWNNEPAIDTFKVGVFGEDQSLVDVLKSMERQEVKGKPVKIVVFNSFNNISSTQVLLVSADRNFYINDLYLLTKNRNTLLVTDRCEYQRYVMINFVYDENSKIKFEINTKNLEEARLITSPKLVLLGGTEIDVRKLYAETEKSLITEKEKTTSYEKELNLKKEEIQLINNSLHHLAKKLPCFRTKLFPRD
jgi:two-component system, chemotaxis family, sensor kinase Cph1